MYLLLIFSSIIGACIVGLFGRYLGSLGTIVITITCLFLSLITSCFAFYKIAPSGERLYIRLSIWIDSGILDIDWAFMFDILTVSLCVVVSLISLLVHVYFIEYLSDYPHLARFMSCLSLFTFFILIFVTAG